MEFHYRVQNNPPLIPILSQINPLLPTLSLSETVILPSTLRLGLNKRSTLKTKFLGLIVGGIATIYSALNFFMHGILICQ